MGLIHFYIFPKISVVAPNRIRYSFPRRFKAIFARCRGTLINDLHCEIFISETYKFIL